MGQRSQIYLKYPIGDNGKFGLIANYYSWCYGERLISRAAWAIRFLSGMIYPEYSFMTEEHVEKMRRYLDVNFDMHDVVISSDLVKEFEKSRAASFPDYVFNQANNDGRLFLNCILREEDGRKICEIHYCFTDCEYNILDAEQYMEWESESLREHWRKLLPESAIVTCDQNMEYIIENATLMDEDELYEMMHFPYENTPKKKECRIHSFALKKNVTMDDIRKSVKIQDGGSWIHKESAYFFRETLEDSIELNIAFPEDLSKWNDYDYILILDDDFCHPYTPFYSYLDTNMDGIEDDNHKFSEFFLRVVEKYNEVMGSLDFLEVIA